MGHHVLPVQMEVLRAPSVLEMEQWINGVLTGCRRRPCSWSSRGWSMNIAFITRAWCVCVCACMELFEEVCIEFCLNAANCLRARQIALENRVDECVNRREAPSLCSHTCAACGFVCALLPCSSVNPLSFTGLSQPAKVIVWALELN